MLKINVPYTFSSNMVQDLFQQASSAQNFEVIEMEQTIATAVNKEPFSLSKLFMQCLPATFTGVFASRSSQGRRSDASTPGRHDFVEEDMGYEESNQPAGLANLRRRAEPTISAVRLHIGINEAKSCRKITVKGLYGDVDLIREFLSTFRRKVHDQAASQGEQERD